MNNTMLYKGYKGSVNFSELDSMYFGKSLGSGRAYHMKASQSINWLRIFTAL